MKEARQFHTGDGELEAGEIKGTYQWPHTVEGQGQPSRQGVSLLPSPATHPHCLLLRG